MNRLDLVRAVDEIATRDVDKFGYGYANSQSPWHYDPTIEQDRDGWHRFLGFVLDQAPGGTALQIGLGRRGGSHLALGLVARRVITVERDSDRVERFVKEARLDPARDTLLIGDSGDPGLISAVQKTAQELALLLIDGKESYEGVAEDWERYAALVRVGGIVAIVDRSQAQIGPRPNFDVDRFVSDLERDILAPAAVRLQRFGNAQAIHAYIQTAASRASRMGPGRPAGFVATPRPEPQGEVESYALFAWKGEVVALPSAAGDFCPRRRSKNEYEIVLVARSRPEAETLVRSWTRAEPLLSKALALLGSGAEERSAAMVRQVLAEFPALRRDLVSCLEAAPWNRRLLLALGMLGLFGAQPREGVMLLRRTFELQTLDSAVLKSVAAAYMEVLQDPAGARELLATEKKRVRRRKVATICHTQLKEHVFRHYPQLLAPIYGVVQVGAHRGQALATWRSLELSNQVCIEANPAAFEALERAAQTPGPGRVRTLLAAVGARVGQATLRFGSNTAHASLLPCHPLAQLPAEDRQVHSIPVEVTTLDALVEAGTLSPDECNLLFVETEGTELEVLRGAQNLLRSIDLICVGVFLKPVYSDLPLPEEIQTFLRELEEPDAFYLCAFEPGPDGVRGQALFARKQARQP